MSDLSLIIVSLRSKVEKLVHLHKKLAEDNAKLSDERQELLKLVEDQKSSNTNPN